MYAATCKVCQSEVKTTHPMQTIKAQMEYHLRQVHNLKGKQIPPYIRDMNASYIAKR